MIPKLKPCFNHRELLASFRFAHQAIPEFEENFAIAANARYALAFPYGRSCLYAFLKALDLKGEVIMPAYSCVVVANAIAMAGNVPAFADCDKGSFLMDLEKAGQKVTKQTKAIVPTSLFGYPVNIGQIKEFQEKGIYVMQDNALAYRAEWKGKPVAGAGDAALYSMGIGKQLSTITGGMLTTDNEDIYEKVRQFRDRAFFNYTLGTVKKYLYFYAQFAALSNPGYSLTYWLWKNNIIRPFTQYFKPDTIDLPKDFDSFYSSFQANLGLEQLKKLPEIIEKRKAIAAFYHRQLQGLKNISLPPHEDGATYSHFVPRVKNRPFFIEAMAKRGIHVGHHFEYVIPKLNPFAERFPSSCKGPFPSASASAEQVVNIPNFPSLTKSQQHYIVEQVRAVDALM
ncbi:DegT/DnrJ/EryC1/StrS family aminotransferase [Candidatus Woesearchaeota archaeon]|nr:DegT/DnrJ/EryC1/StrS family aminotransferase [Candidatus Woesearchaeota archaeon]